MRTWILRNNPPLKMTLVKTSGPLIGVPHKFFELLSLFTCGKTTEINALDEVLFDNILLRCSTDNNVFQTHHCELVQTSDVYVYSVFVMFEINSLSSDDKTTLFCSFR